MKNVEYEQVDTITFNNTGEIDRSRLEIMIDGEDEEDMQANNLPYLGFRSDLDVMFRDNPAAAFREQIYKTDVSLTPVEATIVAPCDLGNTHVLRIDLGDNRILVAQVPPNGVEEGEFFTALYRIHERPKNRSMHKKMASGWRPGNHWHVDFYGCLDYGICHPSLVYSFCCCNCIILAQVANRMNLNWLGQWVSSKTPRRSLSRDTFSMVFLVFATSFILAGVICLILLISKVDSQKKKHLTTTLCTLAFGLSMYAILLMVRTRISVRESYGIPGTTLSDCLVTVFCRPCTMSQMARQTVDYDRQQCMWFTETGVSDDFDEEFGLMTRPLSELDGDDDMI